MHGESGRQRCVMWSPGSTYLYDNYDNLGLINWFLGTMDALHAFLAARSKLVHALQIYGRDAKNSF
jgi:hypothetical protein